jgi:hypothetical protein
LTSQRNRRMLNVLWVMWMIMKKKKFLTLLMVCCSFLLSWFYCNVTPLCVECVENWNQLFALPWIPFHLSSGLICIHKISNKYSIWSCNCRIYVPSCWHYRYFKMTIKIVKCKSDLSIYFLICYKMHQWHCSLYFK